MKEQLPIGNRRSLVFLIFMIPSLAFCQEKWVDTLFSIETEIDVIYGEATDVAGNLRSLKLDISYPTDDTIPECGRPLMVFIHGGAFVTGSKSDGIPSRMREDFAKRGYTAASINYRLGQFNTHQQVNCNISSLGVDWNCLNMADTSEWYRAYFRGIQDVNGAIRYLVNQADEYDINPDNVFLVGESAGGFIAMGVGFIDEESEVVSMLTGEFPDAQAPNAIYEAACVQTYGIDTSIASMDLARPALGPYSGTLNLPVQSPYRIRGVGNFYGGAFSNIFSTSDTVSPALYLFHQPNDLIVPYDYNRIFAGYAFCATQFPFNCGWIINRPFTYGSKGIKDLIDTLAANGLPHPVYQFDNTTNTANCAQQIFDPSTVGHSFDSYWNRTTNMAAFFAGQIAVCAIVINEAGELRRPKEIQISPNPVAGQTSFQVSAQLNAGDQIRLWSVSGHLLFQMTVDQATKKVQLPVPASAPSPALIFVEITTAGGRLTKKVILLP